MMSEPAEIREIRSLENVWIPMPDGVKLAARIWMPIDAERHPVPAILEYIPYRKRDFTRLRDETLHPFWAAHGYACVRVDIRGSGDSEGIPQDEYVAQEQDDGLRVIEWLASQPWCSGAVGMFGVSWSGFNALQLAALRPAALKAIITHCSSDDRYTDGDHWMGGCIEETFLSWGTYATLIGARPPDLAIVGDRWRAMWAQRVDGLQFYVGHWLEHPHRDAFWKHASISEDYAQIQCAVYAVGGWADHFNSTVTRMMENLSCPRKALIGPWTHAYPHLSKLGPAIDWLHEGLRWWDHWLKAKDTGVMDEPMLRFWMQHEAAMPGKPEVAGHWVAEEIWPSTRIQQQTYFLNDGTLDDCAGVRTSRMLEPLQTVGVTAPARYYRNASLDISLPTDQRVDDARSLTFDSTVLTHPFEILGAPIVALELSVDKPVAFVAVRLNEVTADGISKRISFGVFNLTHRDSHEYPEPLIPGESYRVSLTLHDCAHRFKPGSRVRVAVSTTYWPAFWPSPEAATLTLFTGVSTLQLPIRPQREADHALRPFGSVLVPETSGRTTILPASPEKRFYEWDMTQQKLVSRCNGDAGCWKLNATDTELAASWSEVAEIVDHDPGSARVQYFMTESYRRESWNVRVEATLTLSVTRIDFVISGLVTCYEQNAEIFTRRWEKQVPRRLV